MSNVYITSAVRTAVGSFQGAFAEVPAPRLGAAAIREAVARLGLKAELIDEVIMGNVLQAGLGQNPARQALIYGGVPAKVGAMTINKVCGSGLKSIALAAQAIRVGDATCILAGGFESMTQAPYALPKAREGYRMGNGTLVDLMIHDGLWDPYKNVHMVNCGDQTSAECGFSL